MKKEMDIKKRTKWKLIHEACACQYSSYSNILYPLSVSHIQRPAGAIYVDSVICWSDMITAQSISQCWNLTPLFNALSAAGL